MKSIVKYLLLASFIGTIAEQMITPLYGIFVTHIGGGVLEAGTGFAIFSIITGIIITITGKMKWFQENTHLVMMLGFIISGVGDFAYFFVNNYVSMFIVQAVIGVSVGMLNPSWETIYTKEMEDGEEHESWSLFGGGYNVAIGISAIMGSIVVNFFGFKAMFVLAAIVNIVAIYFSYLVYKKKTIRMSINGILCWWDDIKIIK